MLDICRKETQEGEKMEKNRTDYLWETGEEAQPKECGKG